MKKLIFLVLATTFSFALTVKDKIYEGSVENYVIYEHNRSALALVIHRLESDRLTIEEIATSINAKPSHLTWQAWLEQGAPGHTSWLIYDLDPKTGKLFDAYSFSKGCFVTLQDQAPMTAILLEAKLTPIPDALRKRVGAKPSAAAFSDRAIWQPPLFINGKKEKSFLDAFASSWPDDASEFSKKDLTLYYGKNLPFPCWIEISREHKLRAIDMGKKLNMVLREVPKRKPFITKVIRDNTSLTFHIENPSRLKDLSLFALDTTNFTHETIPLEIKTSEQKGKMTILQAEISKKLKPGNDYTWMAISSDAPSLTAESTQKISFDKLSGHE